MELGLHLVQKRNWYAREALAETLSGLGLPATLDSTHVVFRDMHAIAEWMLAASDEAMASCLGYTSDPMWKAALEVFAKDAGPLAVAQIRAPGISFDGGGGPVLDGVAMTVRLVGRGASSVDDGPHAYVVPVSKQMLNTGAEWNDIVALVPKSHVGRWGEIINAVSTARRSLRTAAQVMQVYNGSDIKIQPVKIEEIIMDDAVKSAFVDDLTGFMTRRDWYTRRGLPWTRRYLLNGAPGTGKTTLGRWAATNLGMPAYSFDFTDRYADGRQFSSFLSYVRRNAPGVIILDDLEKVIGGENKSDITSHSLLTAFSGMGSLDGVVIIATSNSREAFNGPMRRRFDSIIEVPLPTREKRCQYLERLISQEGLGGNVVTTIADKTNGMSYDDLRCLVTSAAGAMVKRKGDTLSAADLTHGLGTVTSNIGG